MGLSRRRTSDGSGSRTGRKHLVVAGLLTAAAVLLVTPGLRSSSGLARSRRPDDAHTTRHHQRGG